MSQLLLLQEVTLIGWCKESEVEEWQTTVLMAVTAVTVVTSSRSLQLQWFSLLLYQPSKMPGTASTLSPNTHPFFLDISGLRSF